MDKSLDLRAMVNCKRQNFEFLCVISYSFAEYYGHDGPVMVDSSNIPILDLWFQAGNELGYSPVDPNGFQSEGKLQLRAKRG